MALPGGPGKQVRLAGLQRQPTHGLQVWKIVGGERVAGHVCVPGRVVHSVEHALRKTFEDAHRAPLFREWHLF